MFPTPESIHEADLAVEQFLAANQDDDWVVERGRHWRRSLDALAGLDRTRPTLYCLGDSHLSVFDYIQTHRPLEGLNLAACQIRSASAAGLGREDSLVRSRLFARSYLARIPARAPLLLCFGEVDCNSRIPFRMHKYGTTTELEIAASLENYARFIDRLRERRPGEVIVYTVHPPCQRRNKPEKDRRLWLDLAQRTAVTRRFNRQLIEICSSRDLAVLDLEDQLLDPKTGLIAARFLRRSKTNHHLEEAALAPLLRAALSKLLSSAPGNGQ